MKRLPRIFFVAIFVMLACAGTFRTRAEGLDSLRRHALETKLWEYFAAMDRETAELKMHECDFLVESCTDSLVRQFVAVAAYKHYLDSPVMGDEAVAIYLLDKWFFSGKVEMPAEEDMMYARVFADFNRNSLIGMDAPVLNLYLPDGSPVELFGGDHAAGRMSVLYFYDVGCRKCILETALLRNLFMTEDYPVDFFAVYVGDKHDAWQEYVSEYFSPMGCKVGAMHLWDPGFDSDFQRKYGVVMTPGLFLISSDGTIIGRGLSASALGQMLDRMFGEKELEYGSAESVALFDGIFGSLGPDVCAGEVSDVVDRIYETTLGKGDTLMFRQMSGDMLYYMSSKSEEWFKEGTAYLIENCISGHDDIWKTSDDSLKIIGLSRILADLLSKSAPGTVIRSLKVSGELLDSRGSRTGKFSLRKLGAGRNIVIFHTEGCPYCEIQIAKAHELAASDRNVRILLVDVDMIFGSDASCRDALFDAFDLSSLPFLIETDRKGRITRRYFSL